MKNQKSVHEPVDRGRENVTEVVSLSALDSNTTVENDMREKRKRSKRILLDPSSQQVTKQSRKNGNKGASNQSLPQKSASQPTSSSENLKELAPSIPKASVSTLNESMESVDSNISEVLSSNCSIRGAEGGATGPIQHDSMEQPSVNAPNDPIVNKQKNKNYARLDLTKLEMADKIPPSIRQVYISNAEQNSDVPRILLTKINPFKIGKEIESICGAVQNIEYKKSGSILITTKSVEQVQALLKTKVFFSSISVNVTIAWSSRLSEGKLYAPEFAGETMEELLGLLEPYGVVAVRKLLSDPSKAEVPLFVLTFLSSTCPKSIRTAYTILRVDPYYPTPRMCGKCCRFGHSSQVCQNKTTCDRCGNIGHQRADCSAEATKCVNCKGPHEARSKNCPHYKREMDICTIKATEGISFQEARKRVLGGTTQTGNLDNTGNQGEPHTQRIPETQSIRDFPYLTGNNAATCSANALTSSPPENSRKDNGARKKIPPSYTRPPATSNSNENLYISTQESVWITPGQRQKTRKSTSQAAETANDLPQTWIDDDYWTNLEACSPSRNNKQAKEIIAEIVTPLIPIMIKLLLSETITDKIECILEVGTILKSEGLVSRTLDSLGLSSIHT